MAGVSGQGRLLPARLQQEKVAPPLVLFQLCRQKKTGPEGRPSKWDGLKTYRNEASERYIYVISCQGVSSKRWSPHSSERQQALSGWSFAWRSTRPFQNLCRPSSATKKSLSPGSTCLDYPALWSSVPPRRGTAWWILAPLHAGGWRPGKRRLQQPRPRALW